MSSWVVAPGRRPPGIYRFARALRWISTLVFVVLVIFAGTVAYSAVEVARSSAQSHGLSASFGTNGTIEIGGTFTLANPGLYPIEGFHLTARVANASGVFLGKLGVGPSTIGAGSTGSFPIALFVTVSGPGAAASLLTEDQYLRVDAWGNATYAYLFPVSVALTENRSWGAPFEGFMASVGAPSLGGGGSVTVPVTVSFSNHASYAEVGTLAFAIESSNLVTCGTGSFPLNVPPGAFYDQTQSVTLSSGCSPAGGELLSSYTTGGTTIPLPAEPIP